MPSDISFENFQYIDRDRYRKIRDGNSDVAFSYLANYVVTDMDDRVIAIEVDDFFIELDKKLGGEKEPDGEKHLYLPQAGEVVVNPIGEQLIAFCETDFRKDMDLPLSILSMAEALRKDTPEGEVLREKMGHKKSPPVVQKPTTDEELDIIYYENYEYLAGLAGDVMRSNLYVNLFPPLVRGKSYKMCVAYFNYILALKHEYTKLLNFCFNMDFYKEELDGITAASRFHLYCGTTDAVPIRTMSMSFRFSRHGFGNMAMPIRDKEAHEKFRENPGKVLGRIGDKREPNAFEREYSINPIATDLARATPIPIMSSYKCGSLEEILYLEFEKMLELDLRIKKCKNCGRYFILKGNYQTEYCDRVPDGETQTCQNIGATAKYAQKVKDNPAMALFNRAYKRYHARMKVRSVKPDAFKKWQYEAVVMREKCLNGEITAPEFEDWIDGYFDKR